MLHLGPAGIIIKTTQNYNAMGEPEEDKQAVVEASVISKCCEGTNGVHCQLHSTEILSFRDEE